VFGVEHRAEVRLDDVAVLVERLGEGEDDDLVVAGRPLRGVRLVQRVHERFEVERLQVGPAASGRLDDVG